MDDPTRGAVPWFVGAACWARARTYREPRIGCTAAAELLVRHSLPAAGNLDGKVP